MVVYLEKLEDIVNGQQSVRTTKLKPIYNKLKDIIESQKMSLQYKDQKIDRLNTRAQQMELKVKKLQARIEEMKQFSQ